MFAGNPGGSIRAYWTLRVILCEFANHMPADENGFSGSRYIGLRSDLMSPLSAVPPNEDGLTALSGRLQWPAESSPDCSTIPAFAAADRPTERRPRLLPIRNLCGGACGTPYQFSLLSCRDKPNLVDD